MNVIEIHDITKDYGNQKGVFDVSFNVRKGEILGFLGPNGAGKTTTIRQLMGFTKPDKGSLTISGMDCFSEAKDIQKNLGYLPGEIAFIDSMTGDSFIRFVANMKGLKDLKRMEELKKMFELNASGKIKKMSKGMKQKIGIVCAFMQDPDILILDEPTSGLDPLMQNKFIELIMEEKQRGKTILMSSHIFEEVERTCDRAAIIKDGRLMAVEDIEKLRSGKSKTVEFRLDSEDSAARLAALVPGAQVKKKTVTAKVKGSMDGLLKQASQFTVVDMDVHTASLEELFMHFYGGGSND